MRHGHPLSRRMQTLRATLAAAVLGGGALAPAAHAAEFHLFVRCTGTLSASGKSKPGHLDLALRDNNTTALIARSAQAAASAGSPSSRSIRWSGRGSPVRWWSARAP